MKYTSGYKYQLAISYKVQTAVRPKKLVQTRYLSLNEKGSLRISSGYAWDGPSGPTVDTKSFMRGSLVHDALYQLIRRGWLSQDYREAADLELWKICREDGMSRMRAWYVHRAVRRVGFLATAESAKKKLLSAP